MVTLDITANKLFEAVYASKQHNGQPFGRALMEVLKEKIEPSLFSDETSLCVKLKGDLYLEIPLRAGTQEPEQIRLYANMYIPQEKEVVSLLRGYELSLKSGRPTKSIDTKSLGLKCNTVANYDKPFFYWLNCKWEEHCKDKLLECCKTLLEQRENYQIEAEMFEKQADASKLLEKQKQQQDQWKKNDLKRNKNVMFAWLPTMKEIQEANGPALATLIKDKKKNCGELGLFYCPGGAGKQEMYLVIPKCLLQETMRTNELGQKIWTVMYPAEALDASAYSGIPTIIPPGTNLADLTKAQKADSVGSYLKGAIYDCKRLCDDTASSGHKKETSASEILEKATVRKKFLQSLVKLLQQGGTPWWAREINDTWLAEHWKELDLRIVTINDKDGKSTQYIVKCKETRVPGPGSHPTGGEVEICSGAILIPLELGAEPIMATNSMKGTIDRGTPEDKTKIWNQLINEVMPGKLPGVFTSYDMYYDVSECCAKLKECHPTTIPGEYRKLWTGVEPGDFKLYEDMNVDKTVKKLLELFHKNDAACANAIKNDPIIMDPQYKFNITSNSYYDRLIVFDQMATELSRMENKTQNANDLIKYIDKLVKKEENSFLCYVQMKRCFKNIETNWLSNPPKSLTMAEIATQSEKIGYHFEYVCEMMRFITTLPYSTQEEKERKKNLWTYCIQPNLKTLCSWMQKMSKSLPNVHSDYHDTWNKVLPANIDKVSEAPFSATKSDDDFVGQFFTLYSVLYKIRPFKNIMQSYRDAANENLKNAQVGLTQPIHIDNMITKNNVLR